jgi:hypothetical protein
MDTRDPHDGGVQVVANPRAVAQHPQARVQVIINMCHRYMSSATITSGGHISIRNTWREVIQLWLWLNLYHYLNEYQHSCLVDLVALHMPYVPLLHINVQRVVSDHMEIQLLARFSFFTSLINPRRICTGWKISSTSRSSGTSNNNSKHTRNEIAALIGQGSCIV